MNSASPTCTLPVRVTRKTREARDICGFELASLDGQPLPAFSAGAHIDVHTPGKLTRQYSLCNPGGELHRYHIAVLREPASRGGSTAMHDALHEGHTLRISVPRNHFPLHPARRTLLLAGGIGITPLLCMAEQLAEVGADFCLHYCARSAERAAFRERIAASAYAHRVRFHFDDGPPGQRLDLQAELAAPGADSRLYVCGPGGFINHAVEAAGSLGWPAARIHLEHFSAASRESATETKTEAQTGFEVQLASTGQVIVVAPGQTVVRALQRHGIEILTSCEQGVCGTCITRVLEGEPEHKDLYFTDEERAKNDQFTPCCSRARTRRLVLDL